MKLNTKTAETRLMKGYKCDEMFDVLADYFSMPEVAHHVIDFSDAIYSDGFILAVENEMIPDITDYEVAGSRSKEQEFHHIIYNDVCYKIYFKENN